MRRGQIRTRIGQRVRSSMPPGMRRSGRRVRPFRQRPRPPIPILKMIAPADLITLMNFTCGVLAVMVSINGGDGFRIAMTLILVGIIFDGLDGPVARRFGSSHNFGIWLDSIADAMTFCIAPAILIYNMFRYPGGQGAYTISNIIVITSSISIALLGILRLARFSLSQHKWKDFIGLPTPAFAMIVVSLASLFFWAQKMEIDIDYLTSGTTIAIPGLLFLLSFSLVSDILFRKYRGRVLIVAGFFLLVMILSLLFGIHEPSIGMMGGILFTAASFGYLITPIMNGPGNIWGARQRLEEELLDQDEMEGEMELNENEDY